MERLDLIVQLATVATVVGGALLTLQKLGKALWELVHPWWEARREAKQAEADLARQKEEAIKRVIEGEDSWTHAADRQRIILGRLDGHDAKLDAHEEHLSQQDDTLKSHGEVLKSLRQGQEQIGRGAEPRDPDRRERWDDDPNP